MYLQTSDPISTVNHSLHAKLRNRKDRIFRPGKELPCATTRTIARFVSGIRLFVSTRSPYIWIRCLKMELYVAYECTWPRACTPARRGCRRALLKRVVAECQRELFRRGKAGCRRASLEASGKFCIHSFTLLCVFIGMTWQNCAFEDMQHALDSCSACDDDDVATKSTAVRLVCPS